MNKTGTAVNKVMINNDFTLFTVVPVLFIMDQLWQCSKSMT